jgi:hypothetical protein
MKTITLTTTSIALAAGIIALAKVSASLSGVLFILPFALGPLFVTLGLTFFCKSVKSVALLLVSAVAYTAWFFFVYLDAFHWHLDAQSGFVLLVVGIYSLPVMLPLWVAAWRKRAY